MKPLFPTHNKQNPLPDQRTKQIKFKDKSDQQQFLNPRSELCKQTELYSEFSEKWERTPPRTGDGQEFQRLGCHPGHVTDSFYDNEQAIDHFQGSDS